MRTTPAEVKEFSSRLVDQQGVELELPALTARPQSFTNGDTVEIRSGDLTGLRGTIQSVDGRTGTVVVRPLDERLATTSSISVALNAVVKHFDVGASVRACAGPSEGNTGLITEIDIRKKTATVFSPSLGRPFTCLLEELKSCEDFGVGSGGMGRLGGFSIGDLVQLSSHATGVITRIDPAKTLSVLTTEGKTEDVQLSGIGKSCS